MSQVEIRGCFRASALVNHSLVELLLICCSPVGSHQRCQEANQVDLSVAFQIMPRNLHNKWPGAVTGRDLKLPHAMRGVLVFAQIDAIRDARIPDQYADLVKEIKD